MTLFKRKTIWWPTWKGWALFSLLSATCLIVFVFSVHRFLAVTQRAGNADILVVEAWVPEVVLRTAAREFIEGRYRILLTSDIRLPESLKAGPEDSRASLAKNLLEAQGIPPERIVVCIASETNSHRSHAMALSVRDAVLHAGFEPKGMNIMAPAAHARKTWLAYRRAMGPEFPVGIVAVPTEDYNPAYWWKTSQGAKWVIANGVGWLYEWVAGPRH